MGREEYDRIMRSSLHEVFEELKEPISIVLSSVLLHKPNLMKFNKVPPIFQKSLQSPSDLFVSSCSESINAFLMPYGVTDYRLSLPPNNQVRGISLYVVFLCGTQLPEYDISNIERFIITMKTVECLVISSEFLQVTTNNKPQRSLPPYKTRFRLSTR
jgi:hypothetical protein